MSWFGKKISVAAALALAGTSLALAAQTQTITDDPLQGFCLQAAPLCQDGGAPLTKMTGANSFGFDSKPQTTTGTYFVDFLIPDDKGLQTIIVSATQTENDRAFTGYISQIDPGFSGGYFVYEVDLQSNQLIKNSQCITQLPNSVLAVGC